MKLFTDRSDRPVLKFHKAWKLGNLLSTKKYCLAETGHQLKLHKFDIVMTGAPLIFVVAQIFFFF